MGATLFAETESGKPRHWACLISVIILITIINITIVVVLRVLLDQRNEINEYIISDETTRNSIYAFLGFFTLSFFFGCWCCFCCGGYGFQLIFTAPFTCIRGLSNLSTSFINSHNPSQRLREEIDDVELADISKDVAIPHRKTLPRFSQTDTQPFERNIGPEKMMESEAVDESLDHTKRSRAYSIDVGLA